VNNKAADLLDMAVQVDVRAVENLRLVMGEIRLQM